MQYSAPTITHQNESSHGKAFFQTAGRIRNITVPNGSNGRYSFELNEPAGLRFLATMYDGTGWGSGGTTGVLSGSILAFPPTGYHCTDVVKPSVRQAIRDA